MKTEEKLKEEIKEKKEKMKTEEIMPTDEEPIKVICGDCLEVMKDIPDNSVDLIFTDIPFNVGKDYEYFKDDKEYEYFLEEVFTEYYRILKENYPFILKYPIKFLPLVLKVSFKFKYIWNIIHFKPEYMKNWASGLNVYSGFLMFYKGEFKKKSNFKDVIRLRKHFEFDKKIENHQGQTEYIITRFFIEKLTKKGDLILDGFNGTGTTSLVAKQLRRKCIGIEINEEYCNIAKRRLAQEVLKL